jgi:hypothetical protein
MGISLVERCLRYQRGLPIQLEELTLSLPVFNHVFRQASGKVLWCTEELQGNSSNTYHRR